MVNLGERLTRIIQKYKIIWQSLNEELPLSGIGYVATLFWIFATIGPRLVDPEKFPYLNYSWLPEAGTVVMLSAGTAFLLHIGVPIVYIVWNRPFYVSSTWYPLSWKTEPHRDKTEGYLRMPDKGEVDLMIPIKILDSVSGYKFKFDVTDPFSLKMENGGYNQSDQSWDREEKILSSENPIHTTFTLHFKIKEDREVGTGDNYCLDVTDIKDDKNTDVLELEIRG